MFILCQYVCRLPSQLPQANNFWLIDLQTGTFFVISHGSALATRYSILHQRALVRMMDPARSEMGNRNPTMSLGVTALALAGVARTSQLKQETIVLIRTKKMSMGPQARQTHVRTNLNIAKLVRKMVLIAIATMKMSDFDIQVSRP